MTKYRHMDDATLVNLILLGKEDAFDELVERYEDSVKRKAEAIIGNPFSAEDVAQDTFFSAWAHLSELHYREKFGIWILRIAENRAKTLLRRYETNMQELRADMDNFPGSDENDTVSFLAWTEAENNERIHDAIDALGNALRDTVRLHYLDGFTVKEISSLLSIPEGTVSSRLDAGRKQLRRGFGVPEEGNEKLVNRVKRQIREVKHWAVKNDKSGFVETYKVVLPLIYQMDDSPEKNGMLADVLLRGMWWVPGQDNESLRAEIKAAAMKGQNESVIMSIVVEEALKRNGEDRIRFILDQKIPELISAGFKKPLGALYFWLGHALAGVGRTEEAVAAFEKVSDYLPTSHPYYATAISSIRMESRFAAANKPALTHIACLAEVFERENERWFFTNQPGYRRGISEGDFDATPLYWLAQCDGLIDDQTMNPGDTRVSEDSKVTLLLKRADGPVTVPAGVYENCLIYITKGESFCPIDVETVVCPGVGIVKQTDRIKNIRFLLTSADVKGGGRIPFVVGNRWTYHAERDGSGILWRDEQMTEIVFVSDSQVTASVSAYAEAEYDVSTWRGNMMAAQNLYCISGKLCSVEPYLRRAEALAVTPREKAHTNIASSVIRRIFHTDPVFNADYTERGVWNFFKILSVFRTSKGIMIHSKERGDAFEWKSSGSGPGFYSTLYNFLYEIVSEAWGVVWSDEWQPGFHQKKTHMRFDNVIETDLIVCENEDVFTPAELFADCRHICAEVTGGINYWCGHLEFWYASGIGLVKFMRIGIEKDEVAEAKGPFVWELTEYNGKGNGFFPINNGLFRRYEPGDQPLQDGYNSWVEYTISADESGTVIFKNACGEQKRHYK